MGRACSTNGGEERCIQGLSGKPEGRRPLGRSGIGGRIILKLIWEKWDLGHGLDHSLSR
jgi:hypothetical protein